MTKKILVSIAAVILLIAVYCMIFGFSAETGEVSGSRSGKICRACVETVDKVFACGWSEQEILQKSEWLETPIRKLAHFTEYGITAVLIYILVCQWTEPKRKVLLCIVLWILFTAAIDEIHQLYVPGRDGNIRDVCIDTAGGIFWLYLCTCYRKRTLRRRIKHEHEI